MNAPYVTAINTADQAVELLTGARAQSYGDPLAEFERIGRMWAGLLDLDDIAPHTVAAMMMVLKLVRGQQSPEHTDNWVDAVAYGLIAADVVARTVDGVPLDRVARLATAAPVRLS